MNIKSWKLPKLSTLKQPARSKVSPPVSSRLTKAYQEDQRCFERGYN